MKKNIHPEIHQVSAHCACGHKIETISTVPEIEVTICSACHPFYTGTQKFVDSQGRIEKFNKRFKRS